MPIPEGSETNLNGDKPQKWCDARQQQAAAQQQGGNSSSSSEGSNPDWLNIPLPVMNVLVSVLMTQWPAYAASPLNSANADAAAFAIACFKG